jgi:hypothetical protein
VARAGSPLGFRAVPACAALGIASMLALCLVASRAEIAGLVATVAACVAIHAVQASRHRT